MADLDAIHRRLGDAVTREGGTIDAFYVCAHRAEEACTCRKPRPGLILEAQRDWGFTPGRTWLVGDDVRDVDAAIAAGCRPALVATGKGAVAQRSRPRIPAFADLDEFVRYLLGSDEGMTSLPGS